MSQNPLSISATEANERRHLATVMSKVTDGSPVSPTSIGIPSLLDAESTVFGAGVMTA